MKSPFFCAYHVERLRHCECEAFGCWSEMMRRGVQAYSECREEAADIYLGAALDIGLVRHVCAQNKVFSNLHVTKPAEFLIELLCANLNFNGAILILSKVTNLNANTQQKINFPLTEWLEFQYRKVEELEKMYMMQQYSSGATWGDLSRSQH